MGTLTSAQFTIMDYTDGISLLTGISTNLPLTQQYDDASGKFFPSWNPNDDDGQSLVLTPRAVKAGTNLNLFAEGDVTSITWYRRFAGDANWTAVTNGSNNESWNTTTGVLTVSANKLTSNQSMEYRVTGTYLDPVLNLNFPLELAITFSKVKNGTAYVVAMIDMPDGDFFKNDIPATLRLKAHLVRGASEDSSNNLYAWEKSINGTTWIALNSDTAGVITGTGTHTLTLYPDAVASFALFRCKITEKDSSLEDYDEVYTSDAVAVMDFNDPETAMIESTAGNFFKDGVGTTYLICHVYKQVSGNQTEVDPNGTIYTYTWTRTDKDGAAEAWGVGEPIKEAPSKYPSMSATKGKSIKITGTDVDVKATYFCVVSDT